MLIILIVFIYVTIYYYKIKNYVEEALSHIGSLIPTFNPYEFTNINYSNIKNLKDILRSDNYNSDLAELLANVNMSVYNIYSGFDPRFSEGIYLDETLGDFGYILRCKAGLKDIRIFVFRGTKTLNDVLTDLDSIQTEMIDYSENVLVHRGSYKSYQTTHRDILKNYLKYKCTGSPSILVTGHSLGCAMATFAALQISKSHHVRLYMFAPLRVGNNKLIELLDREIPANYAIINKSDLIPTLPPSTFGITGSTWLYADFTNRLVFDQQLGSVPQNHRLDTYICGITQKDGCKEPLWRSDIIMANS
ncbi:MAG TPA: lipase family protein [Aquella sp.]|nr:lipase family protein [Aquella sp.]